MTKDGNPEKLLARQGLVEDAAASMGRYIAAQRWFGGRGRAVASTTVDDVALLREGDPSVIFAIVAMEYADGGTDRYHLPMGRIRGGVDSLTDANKVIAEGVLHGDQVVFFDALADARCAAVYWELMAAQEKMATTGGSLHARSRTLTIDENLIVDIHPLNREQSNTSLVRGDDEVLKFFRRLEDGLSPEVEMTEALAAAGFTGVAVPLGTVEYRGNAAEPILVGLLQPYLSNATEGWALALTSLRDLYVDADADGSDDPEVIARTVEEQGSTFLPEAVRLGETTAEMHLALASGAVPDHMRPIPIDGGQLGRWADGMTADLLRLLASDAEVLEPLRRGSSALAAIFEDLRPVENAGLAIRHHGDYHLGQTVRTDSGWTVLDFEGEPARSLADRRQRSSALRDVAAMMRSFDYAAASELVGHAPAGDPSYPRLRAYGDAWVAANQRLFWGAYLARAGSGPLLPAAAEDTLRLRRAFELQKALYEIAYELGHRPDWAHIPLRFVLRELGEDKP